MLISLPGCLLKNVKPGNLDQSNPDTGIVLISLSQTSGDWLKDVRSKVYIAGPQEGHIQSRNELIHTSMIYTASDFTDVEGKLNVLKLPIGKYRLENWAVQTIQYSYKSDEDYLPEPIVFEVRAGEVAYLGNIHFDIQSNKVDYQIPLPIKALEKVSSIDLAIGIHQLTEVKHPVIIDRYQRDTELFRSKYEYYDSINNYSKTKIWIHNGCIDSTIEDNGITSSSLHIIRSEVPLNPISNPVIIY